MFRIKFKVDVEPVRPLGRQRPDFLYDAILDPFPEVQDFFDFPPRKASRKERKQARRVQADLDVS